MAQLERFPTLILELPVFLLFFMVLEIKTDGCYKSWSGLPLTRPGPRPAQYLEDGGTAEA